MSPAQRSAKEEILARIKAAQASAQLPSHVDVPREYNVKGELTVEELKDMLIDRLEDYKADVIQTTSDDLPQAIATVLHERDCQDARYPSGMSPDLFASFNGTATADDVTHDPRELESTDAVVTESHVTCAQTGTIVLEAGSTNGRRALTLVPDRHVCIVRADSIVYGVPEMIAQMNPEHPATLISGPSATSDIELSRVEGVHGPRDLIVIIVD